LHISRAPPTPEQPIRFRTRQNLEGFHRRDESCDREFDFVRPRWRQEVIIHIWLNRDDADQVLSEVKVTDRDDTDNSHMGDELSDNGGVPVAQQQQICFSLMELRPANEFSTCLNFCKGYLV
jgi:hypothetical protein